MGKRDILLSYSWVRSTYAALCNLASHKLKVFIADSTSIGMCQLSKYKKKVLIYTDFLLDGQKFIDDIEKILNSTKPAVYIPSHDETELIALNIDRFSPDIKIPIPSVEQIILANDKSQTQKLAEKTGVAVAQRYVLTADDILVPEIPAGKKIVIRLRKGNSAKGVFYATGPEQTKEVLEKVIEAYQCGQNRLPVVQEHVNGEGWGVSCLYWKGERIIHFTHRRLREKTSTGGTSTIREHQPNAILENMAFTLLDALKWHGVAMVEFKYNPQTKQAWFIEINPRLWGSIHLAISAGVEFPYLLYLCATEGPEAAKKYQSACNVKYPWKARWYLGDCIAAFDRLRKGKVLDAARSIMPGGADTYDDINWRDPGAFIGEFLYYGTGFLRSGKINPAKQGMIG